MPSDGPPNLLVGHIADLAGLGQWAHVFPGAVIHDAGSPPQPGWAQGDPVAIVNHFTAVCGSTWPGFGRFKSEGIGSAFGIKRIGGRRVCQYVDADRSTWHAFDRSRYAIGIEWDASPPGCAITAAQVEAGAALNAWLCKEFGIPAVRAHGPGAGATGIGCHTDGRQPGATWDPNGHYDSPWDAAGDQIDAWVDAGQRASLNTSPTSFDAFVAKVAAILNPPDPPGGGDDLTPAQEAQLQQAANAGYIDMREAVHHGIDVSAGKPWRETLAKIRAAAARKTLGAEAGKPTPIPPAVP